jgi:hypothetical protein
MPSATFLRRLSKLADDLGGWYCKLFLGIAFFCLVQFCHTWTDSAAPDLDMRCSCTPKRSVAPIAWCRKRGGIYFCDMCKWVYRTAVVLHGLRCCCDWQLILSKVVQLWRKALLPVCRMCVLVTRSAADFSFLGVLLL